jgi:multidrug resistance efflux pump
MDTPKKIFPHEVVEYSVEKHFQDYNPGGRRLYLIVLVMLGIFFLLMFIVKVDVSIRSTGVVRPLQGRTEIRSAIEGIVDSIYVSENMHVKAGQPLLKVHSKTIDEKGVAIGSQIDELKLQVEDLKKLLAGDASGLKSGIYTQQYDLYEQKLHDARVRYDLVAKNYNRYAQLYKNNVISAAEYDKFNYERKAVESELGLIKEQQYNQWQADLTRYELQLEDMGARKSLYDEQKSLHVLRAPVSGNVQELKGIQPGSYVSPNDMLGEISPDSGMIAEAYVLPKDIGLMTVGTPVRMMVDAFDYNEWGLLKGKIESISTDIFTDSGQPYFKVRCRLDRQSLRLKNGYEGHIKKGMTLQARFIVARRSLFQLLYDKTDDWLNPNMIKEKDVANKD